jgi:alkanesulfonate monooxygenase SsuD/methylene tetrahydromethanopterin reductase-like flavin-dependent oxidoreductase (luciferase family)
VVRRMCTVPVRCAICGADPAAAGRRRAGSGPRKVKWGVLLPTVDALGQGTPPVTAAARRAEELGFDTVWAGDHLLSHAPVLDSLCALSAAAAVTSRVELGVSVLQLGLRQPAWVAKQLATIEALAPGRLRLGVGVGGEYPEEFLAAGVPRSTRGQRLDEMLRILPALLRGEPVDHPGPLAPVRVPGLRPAVSSPLPVSVGGRSEAALRRAAQDGDQWLGIWRGAGTVRSCAGRLATLATEQGRPVPSIAMLVLVNVNDDAGTARREAADLVRGQYQMPLRRVERWTAYGPPDVVAAMLREYTDAGVSEFVLMPASGDVLGQYGRLAAVRELVPPAAAGDCGHALRA